MSSAPSSTEPRQIVAAGTIVIRPGVEGKKPAVLVVHRPGYKDWTLPKGKPTPGETMPVTAIRETAEETAAIVRLDVPVDRISYPVGGGIKTVYYWRASLTSIGRFKPNKEIDKVAWLTPAVALKRLTYADEAGLLQQALEQPVTTPLLIVRHGKAMLRKNWSQRDAARPLDSRGRQQADDLVPLLSAYHVEGLSSSTSTRCMQTLAPYAKQQRLDVNGWNTLTEELGEENEPAVTKLMARLANETAASGRAQAICGHRPVLPFMLESVGVAVRPMKPGETCVVHLTPTGEAVAVEWHPPIN